MQKISVVGSGPSAFYTASKLLQQVKNIKIDLYEQLPIPYGLVRFGVAPDHPEVKNVIHKFDLLSKNPRFRFIGNVKVGRDVEVNDLKNAYDKVVFAYGSSKDNELNLENEHSLNVLSARSFVGWYNGDPQFTLLKPDLSTTNVAIIGMGNVALDVARILLSPIEILEKTDITEHSLRQLRNSKVKNVYIFGRRGPLEAAFTSKELKEMFILPNVDFKTNINYIKEALQDPKLSTDRPKRRLLETLLKSAQNYADFPTTALSKSWNLHFLSSPTKINIDTTHKVQELIVEENDKISFKGTGNFNAFKCGLIMKSIGYKSVGIDGVPFDCKKGIIPNSRGRVESEKDFYVSGWVKRGPTGVIASTMHDSYETSESIIEDLEKEGFNGTEKPGFSLIKEVLKRKNIRYAGFEDWKRLDLKEVDVGFEIGKPREKFVEVAEMMGYIEKTSK